MSWINLEAWGLVHRFGRLRGPRTPARATARAVEQARTRWERENPTSIEDYHALAALKPDFKAYLLGGPKVDDFTVERDSDTGRAVEL